MSVSNIRRGTLIVLIQALISGCLSQSYIDLEALGINCPSRDRCQGYRNHLTYMDRSCECDFNCTAYKDCCIDAVSSEETVTERPAARTDVKCLHYGNEEHTGVYVISKCRDSWSGSRRIRQRCTASADDFSDPLSAAPTTDVVQSKTYRNLACARCNYANMTSLTTFQLRMRCPGVELTEDQVIANLTYNSQRQLWGVYTLNRFGNGMEFFGCHIIFNVPEYLSNSVRFCRPNLISTCVPDWTRPTVARQCEQYMAAVYSSEHRYRNPHCAICNRKTVDELSCQNDWNNLAGRKGSSPYPILVDVNPNDGNFVGKTVVDTPECPSGEIYDAFFKRCRKLVCALPGRTVVNGRCVRI